jgi:hypothetical protein
VRPKLARNDVAQSFEEAWGGVEQGTEPILDSEAAPTTEESTHRRY